MGLDIMLDFGYCKILIFDFVHNTQPYCQPQPPCMFKRDLSRYAVERKAGEAKTLLLRQANKETV